MTLVNYAGFALVLVIFGAFFTILAQSHGTKATIEAFVFAIVVTLFLALGVYLAMV